MCLCVLKLYPVMLFRDHEGERVCVCVLKMYPAMLFGDHEGEFVCVCVCVEDVSSYGVW